ncbi:MAG: hypothetical protein H7A23_06950 [Leptospiraceae bacterium]|nr:hypothetical protein [Leptospiraceae bacterium]MCP5494276.1 hypothetical protein [Leptospiraceae bacterium]
MFEYFFQPQEVALQISGPFKLDKREFFDLASEISLQIKIKPEDVGKYILRFWSKPEPEEHLRACIFFMKKSKNDDYDGVNYLLVLGEESEKYHDIMQKIHFYQFPEDSEDSMDMEIPERFFIQKLSELLEYAEYCIEEDDVPIGKIILWSKIHNQYFL